VSDLQGDGASSRLTRRLNEAVARAIDTPPAPLRQSQAPKNFQPGVKYEGGRPVEITTAAIPGEQIGPEEYESIVAEMGVNTPPGYRLVLAEANFDPVAWTRDEPFWIDENGHQRKTPATTRPAWRYRFKVVPEALAAGVDEDLSKLMAEARKKRRAKPAPAVFDKTTMVVTLGDIQAGKVDHRGGTAELLDRLEYAKGEVVKRIRRLKPHQLVLVDGGDAMENFESSPGSDRTNDLQLTQQMRLVRRVFWDWTSTLAPMAAEVDWLGVPSNHCRVRRGKQNMAGPSDDYGLEIISQLADIAAQNEAYSHVNFWTPAEHEESLALTLVGGKTLGAVHGHQMAKPDSAVPFMTKQVLGQTPLAGADVVIINHFHTFWMRSFGKSKWMIGSPTMDSGSSWYRNVTGEESDPGVLTFMMDENGWRDLEVIWAREGVDYGVIS
jgi:hypothetical protein